MKETHFTWLTIVGLLAGFGLGLLYAWMIAPPKSVDTSPASLRADFKDDYRAAIASAYAATGNLERARARLALLGDGNPAEELTAQAQRMLAESDPLASMQAVALLAESLQGNGPASPVSSPTSAPDDQTPVAQTTPTQLDSALEPDQVAPTEEIIPTPGLLNTPTPRPLPTVTPRPGRPLILANQETLCDPTLSEGLLQVMVIDSERRQIPGVEVVVTWGNGEEHFFTGLKPELGNGYGDFLMDPETTYSISAGNSAPVSGLQAPTCQAADESPYWGALKLTFQQQ
jgi:hypothetical protein